MRQPKKIATLKHIKYILALLSLIVMTSCNNTLGRKKLNLKTVENKEILVETYNISEITTIHQFIDITNKRWHKVWKGFLKLMIILLIVFLLKKTVYF